MDGSEYLGNVYLISPTQIALFKTSNDAGQPLITYEARDSYGAFDGTSRKILKSCSAQETLQRGSCLAADLTDRLAERSRHHLETLHPIVVHANQ